MNPVLLNRINRLDEIENLIDDVLICIEVSEKNLNFISWYHDIVPITDKGIEVYRVITFGIVKNRIIRHDFLAVAYVAKVFEESYSCVEMVLTLSNGKRYEFRPEVDFEKCLHSLRGSK